MSKELGFFTKEQEKALAEVIDDAIKLKGFAELVDGFAARSIISLIDDELLQKQVIEKLNVDSTLIDDIGSMAEKIAEKDYEGAALFGSGVINELIDIPGLGEESEAMLFSGALQMLVGAIKKKAA